MRIVWLVSALLMMANMARAAEDPLRVSLVALSASGAASGATTSGPAFVPREGERCTLQVTIENRSDKPVALSTITVSSTGIVSVNRKPEIMAFNEDRVECVSQQRTGDQVDLTFRYLYRVGQAPVAGRLAGLVGGGEQTPYHWASPDGVLLPGKSVSKVFRWIPLAVDGSLSLAVSAKVLYVKLGRPYEEPVLFPASNAAIPSRPEWTKEEPSAFATQHEEPPFTVTFAPLKSWDEKVSFVDALIPRDMSGGVGLHADGANRILVQPRDRPLKALLPQLNFRPGAVAYSPALDAWFLSTTDRTAVIQGGKRFEVTQDLTDFFIDRALNDADANPWNVLLDRDAAAFAVYLKNVPRERERGSDHDTAKIPLSQILDRIADADRAGLRLAQNGALYLKRY